MKRQVLAAVATVCVYANAALGEVTGELYWTSDTSDVGKLRRSNPDGSIVATPRSTRFLTETYVYCYDPVRGWVVPAIVLDGLSEKFG